jgi:hypothetical protein
MMSWQWYEWDNLELFNSWHDQIKLDLGLPRMSIDNNGQECEPMITAYTEAIESEGKIIAMVETEFATELQITDLRPLRREVAEYDQANT